MTNNDLIRRYKHQRRRNARTIRERNETIRELNRKVQNLGEVVDDYRFMVGILHVLLAEKIGVRDGSG